MSAPYWKFIWLVLFFPFLLIGIFCAAVKFMYSIGYGATIQWMEEN